MTKRTLVLIFVIFILCSCKKDEVPFSDPCLQLSQNPGWAVEAFKNDYSIQFPSEYMGGVYGFEGYLFRKKRIGNEVEMAYAFCNPLYCVPFGDELIDPTISSIQAEYQNGKEVTLQNRQEICYDLVHIGVYYFNDSTKVLGKLFWYDDSTFKEALTVYYENGFQNEVESIIKTIRRK